MQGPRMKSVAQSIIISFARKEIEQFLPFYNQLLFII